MKWRFALSVATLEGGAGKPQTRTLAVSRVRVLPRSTGQEKLIHLKRVPEHSPPRSVGGSWWRRRQRPGEPGILHRNIGVNLRPLVRSISFRAQHTNRVRNFDSADVPVVIVICLFRKRSDDALHGGIGAQK